MRNGLSLLIALSVSLGCAPAAPNASPGAAVAGGSLPSTPLAKLDGGDTPLSAYLGGRAAVVTFWATWCDACRGELGALNRLDAETRNLPNALVLGVAVGESRETVAAFVERNRLTYAQLVDPDFAFVDALGERRVPATLVVDRNGRIVFRGGALAPPALAAFRTALGSQ
jgi:peroxiredoxin